MSPAVIIPNYIPYHSACKPLPTDHSPTHIHHVLTTHLQPLLSHIQNLLHACTASRTIHHTPQLQEALSTIIILHAVSERIMSNGHSYFLEGWFTDFLELLRKDSERIFAYLNDRKLCLAGGFGHDQREDDDAVESLRVVVAEEELYRLLFDNLPIWSEKLREKISSFRKYWEATANGSKGKGKEFVAPCGFAIGIRRSQELSSDEEDRRSKEKGEREHRIVRHGKKIVAPFVKKAKEIYGVRLKRKRLEERHVQFDEQATRRWTYEENSESRK
ncbi:hypothetical protein RUND412_005097 [Rhizina undulata]